MSNLGPPTPDPSDNGTGTEESLETLRAQLLAQRKTQKACLAKHKRTTSIAVESARKGTTYYDPEKLQLALAEEDEAEEPQE